MGSFVHAENHGLLIDQDLIAHSELFVEKMAAMGAVASRARYERHASRHVRREINLAAWR